MEPSYRVNRAFQLRYRAIRAQIAVNLQPSDTSPAAVGVSNPNGRSGNSSFPESIIPSQNEGGYEFPLEEENVQCCVCFDTIPFLLFRTLECSHSFHEMCLRRWYRRKRQCPLCRAVIRHLPRLPASPNIRINQNSIFRAPAIRVSSPSVLAVRVSSPSVPAVRVSSPRVPAVRVSSPSVLAVRVSSPSAPALHISYPRNAAIHVSSPRTAAIYVSNPRAPDIQVSSPRIPTISSSSMRTVLVRIFIDQNCS